MKTFITKLQQVEQSIGKEKGAFWLFALFLPQENIGLWDLLVCAPWIDADDTAALRFIVKRLKELVSSDDIASLSHIALIEHDNPGLKDIWSAAQVEHGLVELRDTTFFEKRIERALIITSRRPETSIGAEAYPPACRASVA
jgi:hypothetical protein